MMMRMRMPDMRLQNAHANARHANPLTALADSLTAPLCSTPACVAAAPAALGKLLMRWSDEKFWEGDEGRSYEDYVAKAVKDYDLQVTPPGLRPRSTSVHALRA